MSLLVIILTVLFAIGFAILSRMAGGGYWDLPYGLDQWLYALPYAILGAVAAYPLGIPFALLAFAVSGTTAFLCKRTGHGQYMDLGAWNKEVEPERLDPIVEKITGRKDNFKDKWRDFVGLCVTGGGVPLGASATLLLTGTPLLAAILLLGGIAKSVAYLIGWTIFNDDRATEVGEHLTGFFGGLPLGFSLLTLLGL